MSRQHSDIQETAESRESADREALARMDGARTLSWRSKFLYGPYPFVFRTAPEADPSVHWLDGEEQSAPLNLAGLATKSGRA